MPDTNRFRRLAIAVVTLAIGAGAAQAQDNCVDVLKFAGTRYVSSLTSEQISDLDYYYQCTEQGRASQGTLNIGFKGFELGLGGSSYKTTEDCQTKLRDIDISRIQVTFTSEPFTAAIATYEACMLADARQISVKPNDDGSIFGVAIENRESGPGEATFYIEAQIGEDLSPDSCKVFPPASRLNEGGEFGLTVERGKNASVSCTRPKVSEIRQGLPLEFYPKALIGLHSGDSPKIGFPYPETIVDINGRFKELEDRVAKLTEALGTVEGALATGAVVQGDGSRSFDRDYFVEGDGAFPLEYDGRQMQAQQVGSCPAGQVVTGIRVWALQHHQPCVGCLAAVQPVCGKIAK